MSDALELTHNRETITKEDYVPVQPDGSRCVDDRPDLLGENRGAQLPGGSEHIADLMLVALSKTGITLEDADLFEMTEAVYMSETAQQYNLKPGVHIDDDHGHITDDTELEDRDKGCGYDNVRVQVLQRLGVNVTYKPGTRIKMARKRGWGVQVLAHGHDSNATAAVNKQIGLTLDTNKVYNSGKVPSFNHDEWVVDVLLPEMVNQLNTRGYTEAAKQLQSSGLTWSREIYAHTLDILTEGRLNASTLKIME